MTKRTRTAGHPDGASPGLGSHRGGDGASHDPSMPRDSKGDTGSNPPDSRPTANSTQIDSAGEAEAETTPQSVSAPASPAQGQGGEDTAGDTGGDGGAPDKSTQIDSGQGAGDAPSVTASVEPLSDDPITREKQAKDLRSRVTSRLMREGRWRTDDLPSIRDEMSKLARKKVKDKWERMAWVYSELDRLYPPLEKAGSAPPGTPGSEPDIVLSDDSGGGDQNRTLSYLPPQANNPHNQSKSSGDGQMQGLSSIPDDWPELPANASLGAEVAWVQANRLRIVEDKPGGATVVRLEQALSAAPSWAALGWLETSIRSYAKYVDVAAKATASGDGEADVVRRERVSVDEVRGLLEEMAEDDSLSCPHCGKQVRS